MSSLTKEQKRLSKVMNELADILKKQDLFGQILLTSQKESVSMSCFPKWTLFDLSNDEEQTTMFKTGVPTDDEVIDTFYILTMLGEYLKTSETELKNSFYEFFKLHKTQLETLLNKQKNLPTLH